MEFPLPTGMLVLLVIALVVWAISHWRVRRFWPATLMSAIATTTLFAAASFIQAGVPTSFEPRPLAYFTGAGLLVAMVMGLLANVARCTASARA